MSTFRSFGNMLNQAPVGPKPLNPMKPLTIKKKPASPWAAMLQMGKKNG